jgi:phosphatidylglycerol lysyltransferase
VREGAGAGLATGTRSGPEDIERARRLVLRHGRAATCWQVLLPGLYLWFDPVHPAVVGYAVHGRVRVAVGEPVCPGSHLGAVAARFERDASRDGRRVCWLAAEEPLAGLRRETGDGAVVPIGAQPVWEPARLVDRFRRDASLRYQLNRARNKGLAVWERSGLPGGGIGARQCLSEWLGGKRLRPLGFMTDPYLLDRMAFRRLFTAERAGRLAGYAVLTPVPGRKGWLVEQIVRCNAAPNGTSESLVAAAARTVAAEGCPFVTLGAAPLSRRGGAHAADIPMWLRWAVGWMRSHGTRFYNFGGLEGFKAKFGPCRWEPVFAVATEPRIRPTTLFAVLAVFFGGSPLAAGIRILRRCRG